MELSLILIDKFYLEDGQKTKMPQQYVWKRP